MVTLTGWGLNPNTQAANINASGRHGKTPGVGSTIRHGARGGLDRPSWGKSFANT